MRCAPDTEERLNDIIAAIYDTALGDTPWTGVLPQIADITGGFAGALVLWDTATVTLPVMHHVGWDARVFEDYGNHYIKLDPRADIFPKRRDIEIYTDEMLISPEVKKHHEYFHWQRSAGQHHAYGARLFCDREFESTLMLGRSEKQGEAAAPDLSKLALLVPHLRRSITLGQKLGDRFSTEALDTLPFGAVILDEQSRVSFVNKAAARIAAADDGIRLSSRALSLWNGGEDAVLERVVSQYRRGLYVDLARERKRLSASRPSARQPYVLTVAPLPRRPASLVPANAVMICITDPHEMSHLQSRSLADIFGLSPAEAELTLALVKTGALRLAARQRGLTDGSARQYMKRVFSKTGTCGQVELMALILTAVRP